MYAVDNLSDAIDVTREFLTPAQPGLWLRLAVVVFFVSSLGFGGPTAPTGDFGATPGDEGTQDFEEGFETETGEEIPWEDVLLVLLVVGLVLFAIWLVYAVIAAVMEFVFIESLRSSEVHVRQYFRENLGLGLRLFGFRLVVMLVGLLLVAVPAYFLVTSAGGFDALSGATIAAIVLLGLAVTIAYSLVMRFTSEFVAPVMLLEGRGVLPAWGRFWPTLTGNLAEYVVYLLLVWILQLVVGIAAFFVVGILLLVVGLVLAIPLIILGFVLFAILGDLAVVPMLLLAFVGVLLLFLVTALVWVPIETYFQYYALLLLGDTDADLDLIPEQRAAVRGEVDRTDERDDEWTTGSERADEGDEFDWGTTDDEAGDRVDEDRDDDTGWDVDGRDEDRDEDDRSGW